MGGERRDGEREGEWERGWEGMREEGMGVETER